MTAPAVDRPSGLPYRNVWIDRMVYAGMATSLAASPLLSPHTAASGPVLCPFRRITGMPCPGCGMTRSFVALAHGDLGAALASNRLGPLLMAVFAVALVWKAASLLSPSIDAPEHVVVRASRAARARVARARAPSIC
jgi:hypothetical protein